VISAATVAEMGPAIRDAFDHIMKGVDTGREIDFMKEVAELFPAFVILDMLGVPRRFDQVTLAHIWPESYGNFSDYASEMALPGDFHLQPRNFLLLPRDVHDAFDAGKLGFVPSREGNFTARVFRRDGLPDGIASLDGVHLHLPRALEGHVPYRRSLGWFAWLAKGAAAREPGERAELKALEASDSRSLGTRRSPRAAGSGTFWAKRRG
jgi:hypothetical protein